MTDDDRLVWSEPFRAWIESDWWRERVERELGLRVHGVSSFGTSTIAHRFVADGPAGSLVLRLVRSGSDDCSIELVRLGDINVRSDEAAELRRRVRAVLGENVEGRSGAAILRPTAVLAYLVAQLRATAAHRNARLLAGLPRTHHALAAVVWPPPGSGRRRLRRPVVVFDSVYDGDSGSYAYELGTALRLRRTPPASAPPVYHYSAFAGVGVADIQAALRVAQQLNDFKHTAAKLSPESFADAFRKFARRTLPLLEHRPGLAAPAVRVHPHAPGSGSAVLTRITPGREAALRRELSVLPTGEASPFRRLAGTHAATLSEIAHESRATAKDGHASYLLLTIYGDASPAAQLEQLLVFAPEVSSIWRHCTDARDDERHLLSYLEAHRLRRATTFSAYGHATVREIGDALAVRQRLLSLYLSVARLGREGDPFLQERALRSL
jgi:hypothetical protein